MERLSGRKLFVRWLKDQLKYIGLFLMFALIMIITTLQYRVVLEPVLYGFVMCTFIGTVCLGRSFIRSRRKYEALYDTFQSMEIALSQLPKPGNYLEELCRELIQKLFQSRGELYREVKQRESEAADYYTLWVHQIKTPIAAMNLLLKAEKSERNTMLMRQELVQIEQYAQMALHYLRIQSISSDLLLKECSLYDIVKQAVKKYSISFIEKKLYLNFESFEGTVISDEKWLGVVIEQILSNCVKYTRVGGITIEYDETDPATGVLSISDTGIGIREEDLPRICERGFTGYNGRMDKKSTGIGLYLCKQVMDKLGMNLEVLSEVGKGTRFLIKFDQRKKIAGKLD